jgi:hypothetical protein
MDIRNGMVSCFGLAYIVRYRIGHDMPFTASGPLYGRQWRTIIQYYIPCSGDVFDVVIRHTVVSCCGYKPMAHYAAHNYYVYFQWLYAENIVVFGMGKGRGVHAVRYYIRMCMPSS